MRFIPITEYNEQAMMLAQPVYDNKRRMLLAANNTIHPRYLEKLIQVGIKQLIIEDAESKGITLEEMMDMPTWMDVIDNVQEAYAAVKAKKAFPIRNVLTGVSRLIREVQSRPVVIPVPSRTLAEELKPYAHAVNVALLALQVGKALGYNDLMLRDLAVGCLLHDIGKVTAQQETGHPEAGFNLIRGIREFSLLSAHIAYQHHETLDGHGYPRGISGATFHEYAQICGVCNLYENLISVQDAAPHDAMERIMATSSINYNADVVKAFVRAVPSYPPGTKIRMQTGDNAIVTKITDHMQRPVVRYLTTGQEVSLADNPTLMIAGCC
ncbi:HD domain-containing protein [Paenibacillus validus]|uniref:HD domain-containing protein n=1 Tax=Paenibacillus validus TaxID=44253 RepID=A0A7X2ZBG4_9BACL|nr:MULTISPECIES: HD domain-containing phosphohydrolase [Paenibacillus]MED4603203.1 HD domain-containing protein [Paenibacillus validus]MED4606134.1 HD domain-containing protein [Paenibacillus validus]MUG71893.1 HD domain-containing protein [Paenibacillus validus]